MQARGCPPTAWTPPSCESSVATFGFGWHARPAISRLDLPQDIGASLRGVYSIRDYACYSLPRPSALRDEGILVVNGSSSPRPYQVFMTRQTARNRPALLKTLLDNPPPPVAGLSLPPAPPRPVWRFVTDKCGDPIVGDILFAFPAPAPPDCVDVIVVSAEDPLATLAFAENVPL